MRKVSRREFLGASLVAGYLTAGPNRIEASPLGIPLGFQAYGIRDRIGADFAGSLRAAKEIGYEAVELCSFKGYAKSGFGPLADMKTADIRKVLQDVGMKAPSCHFQFSEFDDPVIDQSIEWATGVGLKFMTLSMARRATTMDQWKQNFDVMNKYGEKVQKAGLIFGYHTHSDEWTKIDGVMVFDEMLRQVDKKHCMYQLDLGGTFANGLDAGKYMAAHPGRFFSLHLKDAKKQPGPGRGIGNTPPVLPVGQGDIDWKETFAGAKKGGITTYFVEMEVRPPTDPMEAMKQSAQYLRNLKV